MAARMSPRLPNSLGCILEPPADLISALLTLPSIAKQTQVMAQNTAPLRRVAESIEGVASDTEALPELQREMARVAKATAVLGPMDARMASIEQAMPTLVSIQQHLARVPDTLERLDATSRSSRLSSSVFSWRSRSWGPAWTRCKRPSVRSAVSRSVSPDGPATRDMKRRGSRRRRRTRLS
jgi:hypothetical protein